MIALLFILTFSQAFAHHGLPHGAEITLADSTEILIDSQYSFFLKDTNNQWVQKIPAEKQLAPSGLVAKVFESPTSKTVFIHVFQRTYKNLTVAYFTRNQSGQWKRTMPYYQNLRRMITYFVDAKFFGDCVYFAGDMKGSMSYQPAAFRAAALAYVMPNGDVKDIYSDVTLVRSQVGIANRLTFAKSLEESFSHGRKSVRVSIEDKGRIRHHEFPVANECL